jgi:hypothetical protein
MCIILYLGRLIYFTFKSDILLLSISLKKKRQLCQETTKRIYIHIYREDCYPEIYSQYICTDIDPSCIDFLSISTPIKLCSSYSLWHDFYPHAQAEEQEELDSNPFYLIW